MLRRRDLKGQEEQSHGQAADTATEEHTNASSSAQSQANANIAPGGLSWKPMRQTNEEWRPQRSENGSDESLIGPDDYFNGAYKSERGVRVQGRVEGSIESKGHILIEQEAQVMADMAAEDITVAGRYNGKTECRRRFEITPSGIVTGEINTDLLVVQEGGYFDGKLKMKERSNGGRSSSQQSKQSSQGAPQRQGAGAAPRANADEEQKPAQV